MDGKKSHFLWKFHIKKLIFFLLKTRSCNTKLSFETSFFETRGESLLNIEPSVLTRGPAALENFLRAHQNALQITTFQMRYQRPQYALFHPGPGPPGPDPKLHYLSAPWVTPKINYKGKTFVLGIFALKYRQYAEGIQNMSRVHTRYFFVQWRQVPIKLTKQYITLNTNQAIILSHISNLAQTDT